MPWEPTSIPASMSCADVGFVQKAAFAEPAGDDEEGRRQVAPAQMGKRVLHVGGVAIVEGEPAVGASDHRIEHHLELVGIEPQLVLASLQGPARFADSVKREVDRPLGHAG